MEKFLSKEELESFIDFCKKWKIKQIDIAKICGLHKGHVSRALSSAKFNKAHANLVIMTKKKDMLEDFDLEF